MLRINPRLCQRLNPRFWIWDEENYRSRGIGIIDGAETLQDAVRKIERMITGQPMRTACIKIVDSESKAIYNWLGHQIVEM